MGGPPEAPGALQAASAAAPSSPAPRRIATPRWFDARLVVGVLLVLGSVLVGARVVSSAGNTYGTVAVRHDLATGTVLRATDLTLAQVRLPDHGRGVYLSRVDDAVGRRLGRDVSAGELLPVDALGTASPRTTLTMPLASAAAPDLRAGERIEVWLSTATCSSVVLLPDVTVQSVHADTSGAFSAGGGGQDVVISVDADVAGRVAGALAIDQAQLRAGILSGRPGAQPSDGRQPSGGAQPSDGGQPSSPLPDISSCASAAPGK